MHHVNYQDKVIAFHRWDRGGARDDVVVIATSPIAATTIIGLGFRALADGACA